MSEKILVATISSEKSPQKGQKHRSSNNFRLYRPQSGFLTWEYNKPNVGFKVCIDVKGGSDKTLYRYITDGSVMPFNGNSESNYYIADPCDANENFEVKVYEAKDSKYTISVRSQHLEGEEHRASDNFSIDYDAIIDCQSPASFDVFEDIPAGIDIIHEKSLAQGCIINSGSNLYFANSQLFDTKNILVSIKPGDTNVYKRPVHGVLGSYLDHTYVVAGDTLFACHGAKEERCDDRILCYFGNPARSNIIARGTKEAYNNTNYSSVNEGTAGIKYLLTGVCHQIANRIIIPTSKTISHNNNVKGYGLSSTFYGTYGLFTSDELLRFAKQIPENTVDPIMQLYRNPNNKSIDELIDEELRIRMAKCFSKTIYIEEIPVSPKVARNKLSKLREKVERQEISYNETLDRVNKIFEEMQVGLAKEINDPDMYKKMFDVLPNEIVVLS